MEIPKNWTFDKADIKNEFDTHVRQQLPWYDIAYDAMINIINHHTYTGSTVYDIGAATGNLTKQLKNVKPLNIIEVDNSEEMHNKGGMLCGSEEIKYKAFDVAVCFLTLCFLPESARIETMGELVKKVNKGGVIICLEKTFSKNHYLNLCNSRLTTLSKLKTTSPDDVIKKNLSLIGVQRPIPPEFFIDLGGEEFFKCGEFTGWVIYG